MRITPHRIAAASPDHRELIARLADRAGPIVRGIACLYRKTLVRSTRVVAVVGSFGKTTASRAINSALGLPYNNNIALNALPWMAWSLLRIRPGRRHAVIEVGINGPGQMIERARTLLPDIVVVTSIGSEHNRSLKNLEVTRHEKAQMVRVLTPSGLAVLNGDDPNVRWMVGETRARVVTFGFSDANDVRATDWALEWPHGTRFTLHTRLGVQSVRIRLIGRPMIYAALAAVSVGIMEGIPLDAVISRVESLDPTPGRLQPLPLPNGAIVLRDDFKAAEETIDAALEVMREIPARRRIIALGDIEEPTGRRRPTYRRHGEEIGRIEARAVFVSDSGNISARKTGAKSTGLAPDEILNTRSIRSAIDFLSDLGPGDVVLVKGRQTQRLERIALALMGKEVRCPLTYCNARLIHCGVCSMLERDRQPS